MASSTVSASTSRPQIIDAHTHHIPPMYAKAILDANVTHIDGIPKSYWGDVLEWSVERQLQHQERLGIERAYLSVSSPGVHLWVNDDERGRRLAQECNDWTANEVQRSKGRLGMYANLPLPDIEGSIAEIKRVYKTYGLRAFSLLTNSHGIYLGDPRFERVWQALDEIEAVIAIHPTAPCVRKGKELSADASPLTVGLWPVDSVDSAEADKDTEHAVLQHGNPLLPYFMDPAIEFSFETTRALTNMLVRQVFSRYPRVRYVVPHAGASLPSVFDRIISISRIMGMSSEGHEPFLTQLQKQCYFDLAGVPFPTQIHGLLQLLPKENPHLRIVYGTDFPWSPKDRAGPSLDNALKNVPTLWSTDKVSGDEVITRVLRSNALELLEPTQKWTYD